MYRAISRDIYRHISRQINGAKGAESKSTLRALARYARSRAALVSGCVGTVCGFPRSFFGLLLGGLGNSMGFPGDVLGGLLASLWSSVGRFLSMPLVLFLFVKGTQGI